MANPQFINCPKDVWTKVATNVTHGQVSKIISQGIDYAHTYRETGDPAPINADEGLFLQGPTIPIAALQPIDVYIFAIDKPGKVRVDL